VWAGAAIWSLAQVKRFEVRARSLHAGSEELGREYRHVAETWVRKALPDF